MFIRIALALVVVFACGRGHSQGIMSDLMSGKLVNPEVGAFAWYNLTDAATGREYFLRQAIVGAERVKRKDAWWLETELVPKVGFRSVYKMLLTGPASDPDNVQRLLMREGEGVVQEIELGAQERGGGDTELPREHVGTETITLPNGAIETEHYIVKDGDETTEIWISEAVPPMGLVRLKTAQGELSLQRYGVGGKDGESAIQTPGAPAAPQEPADVVEDTGEGDKVRKNFGFRRRGTR